MDMDERLLGVRSFTNNKLSSSNNKVTSREEEHRRRVDNLGMLKNQKPTEEVKREEFRRDHKRIITYIDELRSNI